MNAMKPWTLCAAWALLLLLVLAAGWLGLAAAPVAPLALTVYVVRHAEKYLTPTAGLTRP